MKSGRGIKAVTKVVGCLSKGPAHPNPNAHPVSEPVGARSKLIIEPKYSSCDKPRCELIIGARLMSSSSDAPRPFREENPYNLLRVSIQLLARAETIKIRIPTLFTRIVFGFRTNSLRLHVYAF